MTRTSTLQAIDALPVGWKVKANAHSLIKRLPDDMMPRWVFPLEYNGRLQNVGFLFEHKGPIIEGRPDGKWRECWFTDDEFIERILKKGRLQ